MTATAVLQWLLSVRIACTLQVQLREQDFGNFQDQEGKKHEKAERMRYGRFFYRCAF